METGIRFPKKEKIWHNVDQAMFVRLLFNAFLCDIRDLAAQKRLNTLRDY